MHNIYKQDLLNMALRTRNRFVGGSAAMCFFVFTLSSVFVPNVFAVDLDGKALAVAEQVHTGRIVCELGNVVHITPTHKTVASSLCRWVNTVSTCRPCLLLPAPSA